jgi:intracellular septation protein
MHNVIYAARPLVNDLLSSIVLMVLLALKVDVRIAALAASSVGLAQFAWMKFRGRPIAPLQYMAVILVLVSCAATFVTRDPRFVMMKPTVVYLVVATVMLQRGWMLRYIPPIGRGYSED